MTKNPLPARISDRFIAAHAPGDWPGELDRLLPEKRMLDAQTEISSWPGYRATPLRRLDFLEHRLGIERIEYKDESERFGLGSFKALGGAYAVLRYVARQIGIRTGSSASIAEVRSGNFSSVVSELTVVTATDGNHGRSVAWGAKMAGCRCRIYIHAGVSSERAQAMSEFGAEIVRIPGNYDESVRLAQSDASKNGWQVISDTSYDGYMDIPCDVMAGYSLMVSECLEQMEHPPTHVLVQAGVGGLAASVCAALWQALGERRPKLITVESDMADCVIRSLRNGKPTPVHIETETVMAGLSCGEISLIAWEILSRGAMGACTLPDDAVAAFMRLMADHGIEAGECAVPGVIALSAIAQDSTLRSAFELDAGSRVLVFGCEGATDREVYQRMIAAAGSI